MNNKVLVINHTTGYLDKIKALMKALSQRGEEPCLIAFGGTEGEMDRQKLSYKTPADYTSEEDYARFEADSLILVKSLGGRKFDGDTSLVKLLEYEQISLWWVGEGAFWRQVARDLIRYAGSLARLIEKEKPSRIVMVNDDSLPARATIAIGRAKGIPVQILSAGPVFRFKAALRPLWLGLKRQTTPRLRVARDILRKNIARLSAPSPRIEKGRNKILLSATMTGRMQEVVDAGSGKKWQENLYLGTTIRELRGNNANDIVFLYTFSSPCRLTVPGEVKWPGVTVRPREYYLTRRVRRTISEQSKSLKRRWKHLAVNPAFKELCRYGDISLWDTLKDELRLRFDTHFPDFIKDIETSKRAVAEENPDAIVITDEASFTNKSLLVAAHFLKIPTLVLQTGVMAVSNEFLEYGCADGELEGSPSKRPLFPDQFSVYGDATRETLKEAGYPFPDGISVTGQPRYDILSRANETFDREKFRRSLRIEPGKKLALIASQPSTTFANMEELLREALKALKEDPDIRIVIKPKPGPSDTTERWHQQLAEETGAKAVVLPRNSDTNEALDACDVLITGYSTVALEAMVLGKPVVTVNLTGQPDLVPYAQSGAALGVYKAENIAPAVNQALNDPATREQLTQGRERYLYKQFYKLDGQATQRVVELIYRMIEEKREFYKAQAGIK